MIHSLCTPTQHQSLAILPRETRTNPRSTHCPHVNAPSLHARVLIILESHLGSLSRGFIPCRVGEGWYPPPYSDPCLALTLCPCHHALVVGRQCIHADTIHLPCPQYPDVSADPLYTFFLALQDVEDNMGHTVFLPQTQTSEAHLLWNTSQRQKEKFIESRPAVMSNLKKGDVAIFDSRLLHCGCANSSNKRRVLFYFTVSRMQRWPLPGGLHGSNSRREEDAWKWQLKDLGLC